MSWRDDVQFLKTHERLLLGVVLLAVALWLGNKWLNNSADDARLRAGASQQALVEQKKVNEQQAQFVIQQAAQYQALLAMVTAQNQKLVDAMTKRADETKKQQEVDLHLPLPDLGKRWVDLAQLQPTDVQPLGDRLSVSDAGARATVQKLEDLPRLTADLADQRGITANKDLQIGKLTESVTGLNTRVTGLGDEIIKADKVCNDKLALVKADARKGKRNWFIRGAIVGGTLAYLILTHR